jgi:hypothetical protein
MKRNIKLVAAALLLGTQTLVGSLKIPARDFSADLNAWDRGRYVATQKKLQQKEVRYIHGIGVAVFRQKINVIKEFIAEGDPEQKLNRGLACGLLLKDQYTAKNNERLRQVFGGSKSWMNLHWAKLGYRGVPGKSPADVFPELSGLCYAEQRKWTLLFIPETGPQSKPQEGLPVQSDSSSLNKPEADDTFGELGFDFSEISPGQGADDTF